MKNEISAADVTWTNIAESDAEELAEFVRTTSLKPIDAEFIVQNHHRPEVAARGDYLLVLVHIPSFNKQTRVTTGVPLYFVITANRLWTVHHKPLVVLEKLISKYENDPDLREEYFTDGPAALAIHLISELYASAFGKLERLDKHVNIAEDAVFGGNERKMVEEISVLMRDVMDFRKIIRPQTKLFASPPDHELLTPALKSQWYRLNNQTSKLWDLLESLFESVKELAATNASLLQHKENELLRLLTIYSIIVIPILILVDPIFLPGAPDATTIDIAAFWFVLTLLLGTLGFVFIKSKRRRLL